ncbi:MAG: tetratricopeptide repeat protein [bacterium]
MANQYSPHKINIYIGIIVIIIINSLSLSGCINNDFTNWDDDVYVINNIHIRSLSLHNILTIFSSYYYGGYIPVTIISFAINYQFSQNSARAYHLTNFILHLINSLLVFWVIFMLTKKVPIAMITGLFFGIHPLHIESVAWITERKDVLYALFFLTSATLYIYYLHKKTIKFYFLSLSFFILSLLSKPSAISLPFILLLIDYFYSKRLEKRLLLKKIPFFLLSLIFTVLAFIGQRSVGAIPTNILFSLPGNIIIALRIFIFYLYKTILPIKLSCLYPAPDTIDQWQSKFFLFSPLIFFGLVILVIISKKITHKIIFGILFFAFAILPVIQIIPIGQQIADRYTYIPLIGLFYIFAEGWFAYFQKSPKILKILLVLILIFIFSCFSFLSARRCRVWKNGITLWSDVIKHYPRMAKPYNNRGILYAQNGQYELALSDLNQSIALNPNLAEPYNNRGLLFLSVMKYDEAITDFNQAIRLNKNIAEFYNNRGYAFYVRGDIERAISDFNQAINLRSNYPEVYLNRGRSNLTQNRLELALSDLSRAIKLNPFLIDAYSLRASIYARLKKYQQAIMDISQAIKVSPYNAELFNSRGILYCYENNYDLAITDFSRAIALKPEEPKAYNNRGNAYATIGKLDKAIADFTKVISIDSNYVDSYYNRALAYFLNKNFALALQDLKKYKQHGYDVPQELLQTILDSLSADR